MVNEFIKDQFKKLINQIKQDIDNKINPKSANSFRLQNLQKILKILNDYPDEITDVSQLSNIKGISESTLLKINEILETNKLSEIRETESEQESESESINNLEQVIGIGRKTAVKLIKDYGITTVDELIEAHAKGKIELNNIIMMGLKYHGIYQEHIDRQEITMIKKYLERIAAKLDNNNLIEISGSYRRGKPTSNDIDVLLFNKKIKTNIDLQSKENYCINLINHLKEIGFILDDITHKEFFRNYMGFCQFKKGTKTYPIRRIDIKYMPYNSYYTAILHYTGSNDFNINIRRIAKKKGYKLSEHGFFKQTANGKQKEIKINSEKQVFDILDLEYVEPINR